MYVLSGIFGAVVGSFANVCIVRMPLDQSIVKPGSHCPKCSHVLSWWENIPVFSFLFLKGKCRGCKTPISWLYPSVEILCSAIAIFTWWYFAHPLKFFLYYCFFLVPLVIITFIDIAHRIIPDEISIGGIFVGFAVHVILSDGKYGAAAIDSLIGILAGGGSLFLIAYSYEKLKKVEGLGGGDIKLLAMLGAFLGWKATIFIVLFSSIIGSVFGIIIMMILRKNLKYAMPFGPFIAIAGILYLFAGEMVISWYLHLLYG